MNKLNVLWTTDNYDTFANMIYMYTTNSIFNHWWDEVSVIIWGASAKLSANDPRVQESIKQMIHIGISVVACKACSDNLGTTEKLSEIGVDVKYFGTGLTEILQDGNQKLITI